MGHYPYKEGKAGSLRDTHKTAESANYLLADDEIVDLAKDVLSQKAYEEAEQTAMQLTGKKRVKDLARARLMRIVSPPPKRPIYYAQIEIEFLPRWTRNTLRYLGDYVDILVKAAAFEKEADKRIFNLSLGPAIKTFSSNYPSESKLTNFLERYNRFLYRPAKHDFKLPTGRKYHRFTAREVVLSAYVTMQLGEELAKLSEMADSVKNDKENII
jgi:hypothetical protein